MPRMAQGQHDACISAIKCNSAWLRDALEDVEELKAALRLLLGDGSPEALVVARELLGKLDAPDHYPGRWARRWRERLKEKQP
jgi:hypothetical protein